MDNALLNLPDFLLFVVPMVATWFIVWVLRKSIPTCGATSFPPLYNSPQYLLFSQPKLPLPGK